MRKKASAAQLRARAKFAAIMRSGGFKKHRSAKRTRSINKPAPVRHFMARRRKSSSGGGKRRSFTGRAKGILGGARNIFTDASKAVGGATIGEEIATRVYPQAAPVAGYAGAFFAGGLKGVAYKVGFDLLTGRSNMLGGLFGGGARTGGDSL